MTFFAENHAPEAPSVWLTDGKKHAISTHLAHSNGQDGPGYDGYLSKVGSLFPWGVRVEVMSVHSEAFKDLAGKGVKGASPRTSRWGTA